MYKFLNTKIFLLSDTHQIEQVQFEQSEQVFVVSKINNSVPWTYVVNDVNGGKIIGTFYEKEVQKTNQKEFRI